MASTTARGYRPKCANVATSLFTDLDHVLACPAADFRLGGACGQVATDSTATAVDCTRQNRRPESGRRTIESRTIDEQERIRCDISACAEGTVGRPSDIRRATEQQAGRKNISLRTDEIR